MQCDDDLVCTVVADRHGVVGDNVSAVHSRGGEGRVSDRGPVRSRRAGAARGLGDLDCEDTGAAVSVRILRGDEFIGAGRKSRVNKLFLSGSGDIGDAFRVGNQIAAAVHEADLRLVRTAGRTGHDLRVRRAGDFKGEAAGAGFADLNRGDAALCLPSLLDLPECLDEVVEKRAFINFFLVGLCCQRAVIERVDRRHRLERVGCDRVDTVTAGSLRILRGNELVRARRKFRVGEGRLGGSRKNRDALVVGDHIAALVRESVLRLVGAAGRACHDRDIRRRAAHGELNTARAGFADLHRGDALSVSPAFCHNAECLKVIRK